MAAKWLGAHMPTSKGLGGAVRMGKEIGCTAIQVFTSSPQMWRAKPVTDKAIIDFKGAQHETGIDMVVSHDSYLVNLCAPDPEMREKSMNSLKGEIERCSLYGIPYTVSHIGAHLGQGEEVGRQRASESILALLDSTPEDVTLLMETTAGQGSSLHWQFEQMSETLSLCNGHPRIGICLDTAHIYAAGYDIRTAEGFDTTLRKFDELIGLDRLKVVHCNDSKKDLGTRVDRHEHIGQGFLGEETFRFLVNDPRFDEVAILLETPEAEEQHRVNLAKLLSLQNRA